LEELLLEIRSKDDIRNKIQIRNKNDIESIWKHIEYLRKRHSLYSDIEITAKMPTPNAYNPNYSAPPMPLHHETNPNEVNIANISNVSINSNGSQKEGAVTQI